MSVNSLNPVAAPGEPLEQAHCPSAEHGPDQGIPLKL